MTATWGRPEAFALAQLIRRIRPAWDELATINVLADMAGRDLADVAHAAIRTAQDPTMLTPQALKFVDSPHWRKIKAIADTEPEPVHPRPIQTDDEIKARTQAIRHCHYCDDRGYSYHGTVCLHEDPEKRAAMYHAKADEARRQLAKATKGRDS